MALAPERTGIGIRRHFTTEGRHPYDEVAWERRDARITNYRDGSVAFEQLDVEVPASWSLNATNIVAQKYFRGTLGTPERERSLRQVVDRVVDTITAWGLKDGYFVDADEAEAFCAELQHLVVTQKAAFNSPVWFNIGVPGVPQQASACFILSVQDSMRSILNWYVEEGTIFKGGSGSGINLSRIRSSLEPLEGGGTASGPVSFMRGADASAGTIKSGGKCLAPWQRVMTAEHGPVPVEQLAQQGDFTVLSYDPPAGRFKAKTARAWRAGRKPLVKITTDKGEFSLSPDHPVRLSDLGRIVPAGDLVAGMSLLACSVNDDGQGYLRVGLRDGRKGRRHLHRLVAEDVLGWPSDVHVHHDDENKRNNGPANLRAMSHGDHAALHGRRLAATGDHIFQSQTFGKSGGDNPMHRSRFWASDRADVLRDVKRDELLARGSDEIARMQDLAARQRMLNLAFEILNDGGAVDTPSAYLAGRRARGKTYDSASKVIGTVERRFGSWDGFVREVAAANHRVVSVERLPPADVYDVEVDCPTPDDKTPASGHNFVIWPDGNPTGSGIAVLNTRRAAKMVILNVDHPDIEDFIACKAVEERKARVLRDAGFDMDLDGRDSHSVQYQNANNSVRVTDEFMAAVEADADWDLRAVTTGEVLRTVKARDLFRQIAQAAWECADPGMQFDTTINRWHTAAVTGRINGSNPCSEYMHLDDSACNLASLNLLAFMDEEHDRFDVEGFKAAVEVVFTAQEILVGNADYPTEKIGETSRRFRQLGIGYANLGALLMALGLPYDSDGGRAWAGALSALMTGHAYATSARTAARMGPFAGFAENREPTLRVLGQHRAAAAEIDEELVPTELLGAAQEAWDAAVELGTAYGVRNSQASVLAPTGTIGLMMDCDTTGIEPDLGLCKVKKLVGGGTMQFVNQTVPRALRRLGYTPDQIAEIVAHIDEHKTILGAPHVAAEHVPVFACSMGDNTIHYAGHVRMMGAVQPFISGAISKTVNMPEDVTVEDVEQLHLDAWKLGIKAVAIYRDNCKVGQPLSTAKKEPAAAAPVTVVERVVEKVVERVVSSPKREKLPRNRRSRTFEFRVADCKGFVTVGEYDDGRPGELFLRVSKQGSTLAGIMDAFAISVSHGLQYGVPLKAFVEAFTNMRFEPAGMTDDADIRFAASLVDYIFRRLAVDYLPLDERMELGILAVSERMQPTLPGVEEATTPTASSSDVQVAPPGENTAALDLDPSPPVFRPVPADAPMCMQCGVHMIRAGSCHACPSCGSTSGCS